MLAYLDLKLSVSEWVIDIFTASASTGLSDYLFCPPIRCTLIKGCSQMTSSLLGSIFRLTLFHLDHLDNQHNPAQSNTAQDGPVQPSRAQFRPVELSTSQDGPVQPNTAQHSPEKPSTSQYSSVQPYGAQNSPVQPSTALRSTVAAQYTLHPAILVNVISPVTLSSLSETA